MRFLCIHSLGCPEGGNTRHPRGDHQCFPGARPWVDSPGAWCCCARPRWVHALAGVSCTRAGCGERACHAVVIYGGCRSPSCCGCPGIARSARAGHAGAARTEPAGGAAGGWSCGPWLIRYALWSSRQAMYLAGSLLPLQAGRWRWGKDRGRGRGRSRSRSRSCLGIHRWQPPPLACACWNAGRTGCEACATGAAPIGSSAVPLPEARYVPSRGRYVPSCRRQLRTQRASRAVAISCGNGSHFKWHPLRQQRDGRGGRGRHGAPHAGRCAATGACTGSARGRACSGGGAA